MYNYYKPLHNCYVHISTYITENLPCVVHPYPLSHENEHHPVVSGKVTWFVPTAHARHTEKQTS